MMGDRMSSHALRRRLRGGCIALLAALIAAPLSAADKNEFRLKDAAAAASCRNDVKAPPARTHEAADAIKVLPSDRGIYAGVYSIGTTRADIAEFKRKTQQPPAIVFSFHDWVIDDEVMKSNPTLRDLNAEMEDKGISALELARQVSKDGGVLALTWALQCCEFSCYARWFGLKEAEVTVPKVLRGEYDEYIRRVARQAKSLGSPIMLSLFAEFNWQGAFAFGKDGTSAISRVDDICGQYGDPAWPDGPERIRDVHRHVIDIFRNEGVKNVTWFMYANSGYMDPKAKDFSPWLHPRFFYPGDEYMDWVGQSAYFVDPKWTQVVSKDASTIDRALGAGYAAWGEVTQRPIFLPEFGPVGDMKVNRSAVLDNVMTHVLPSMPRVRAVTLADFLIAEICCQMPRLGNPHTEEIDTWRRAVGGNPAYVFRPKTGAPK